MRAGSRTLLAGTFVALAVAASGCARERALALDAAGAGGAPALPAPRAASRASVGPRDPAPVYSDASLGLAALCKQAKVGTPLTAPRLIVDKRARTLRLYEGPSWIATFPIGLGPSPEGPKLREGDGRTPEGKLRIVTRNANSRYRRFLGLGYPTAADGARGLREGLISRDEADAIARAEREGGQPPWGTKLGGAVGIHGRGSAIDWTAGCVALDDDAIDVLWDAIPIGAEVEIRP